MGMYMFVDYLSYSTLVTSDHGKRLIGVYYQLASDASSRVLYRRSIKGYIKEGLWLGYADNRVSVNISGSKAEDMLPDIVASLRQDIDAYAALSVSRLDLQQTYLVEFDVASYIRSLQPSQDYKVMMITSKQGDNEGIGLYVGSSVSNKRLRVYDKGSQIAANLGRNAKDMYGDGGLLRVELVLRKQSAHKALAAIINGERELLYTAYRQSCVKRIPLLDELMDRPLAPLGVDLSVDKLGRTEKWLMEQVIPAITRVYRSNPSFYDTFMDSLRDRIKSTDLGKE